MSETNNYFKVHCTSCRQETLHDIAKRHEIDASNVDRDFIARHEYLVIVCRGCQTGSFVHSYWTQENFEVPGDEELRSTTVYPDRATGRTPIQGQDYFPARTRRIYSEVIKATNSNMPLLAAIGLRILIESICSAAKAKGRNLEDQIADLATQGLLTQRQANFLDKHRFLGNRAAHQVAAPRLAVLIAALDIAEAILRVTYVLPKLSRAIRKPKKR